jgi:hypothetical protein
LVDIKSDITFFLLLSLSRCPLSHILSDVGIEVFALRILALKNKKLRWVTTAVIASI